MHSNLEERNRPIAIRVVGGKVSYMKILNVRKINRKILNRKKEIDEYWQNVWLRLENSGMKPSVENFLRGLLKTKKTTLQVNNSVPAWEVRKLQNSAICFLLLALLTCSMQVTAENKQNVTSGTLVWENGVLGFYGTDWSYLRKQLQGLNDEITGSRTATGQARDRKIQSKGTIVLQDSDFKLVGEDLHLLANQMDQLEKTAKAELSNALASIGTFFNENGEVTHDRTSNVMSADGCTNLAWSSLTNGIIQSQSVQKAHQPIGEDDLSEGVAGYVNGILVVGNGRENRLAYMRGWLETAGIQHYKPIVDASGCIIGYERSR